MLRDISKMSDPCVRKTEVDIYVYIILWPCLLDGFYGPA